MDALDRTFRHLVQTIQNQFPAYLNQPFEVAELYQTILPYRHHRRELGFETNQDYELVLLQLLAGTRDYLIVDDGMREALARELASPSPSAGAFREFNTAQVSLNPEAVERMTRETGDVAASAGNSQAPRLAEPGPEPRVSTTATTQRISVSRARAIAGGATSGGGSSTGGVPMGDPSSVSAQRSASSGAQSEPRPQPRTQAPAAASPSLASQPSAPPSSRAPAPSAVPTPSRGTLSARASAPSATGRNNTIVVQPGEQCRYCAGSLPAGRRITFCPHCGQNLTVVNCMACGTELELGWKFCTTCGRPVTT